MKIFSGRGLAVLLLLAACSQGKTADTPANPASAATAAAAPTPPELRLPGDARPLRYSLAFTIDPTQPTFTGETRIDLEIQRPTQLLWLNASELTVESAVFVRGDDELAARIIPGGKEFVGLDFGRSVEPGPGTVRLTYAGKMSPDEYGGIFRQEEMDDWYVFTQFEATDARRAFPSFDEPQFKVPFQVTITHRTGHVAVANTPQVSTNTAGDWTTTVFAESKPLPTYLVALAVGPFEIVDGGKIGRKGTPFRIIVPKGKSDQAAHALETTPPIVALLEDYFDMPYPFEKLDQIAVPSFFGGMENPGLITYGMSRILAKPGEDTPGRQRGWASLAAHELAHMWFGDLVTMVWWDDIWLNEAFATWMSAYIVDQWKPDWDGEVKRVAYRGSSMSSDSLDSARQIRQPIRSTHDIENAFDGITYGKGSAVLSMFEAWVGPAKFQAGVRGYMRKHAYGSATSSDFLAALSEAGGPEVATAFETFLTQPGVPLIRVGMRCEKGSAPVVSLKQQRFVPIGSQARVDMLWHVPVCLEYGVAGDRSQVCALLTEPTAEVVLATQKCPDWLQANDQMAGYYRVAYEGELGSRLLARADKVLSLAERIGVVDDVEAQVAAGEMSQAQALGLVPGLLASKNRHLVGATVDIVAGLDQHLIPDDLRPRYAKFIRKHYGPLARQLGWRAAHGEEDEVRLLRPSILSLAAEEGEDPSLRQEASRLATLWLEDETAVDPDMVGVVLSVAAANGDVALWERFRDAAKGTKDRKRRGQIFSAMASFREPKIVEMNLALVLGDDFELRESMTLFQGALAEPATRELGYGWLKANFDGLLGRFPRTYARYLPYTATAFCDEAHAADAQAFFGDRMNDIPGGPRALAQSIETIRLCSASRDKQLPSVSEFLQKQ